MKNPAASGMPMIGDDEREDVVDDVDEDELFILERVNENCFDISLLYFYKILRYEHIFNFSEKKSEGFRLFCHLLRSNPKG